MTAMKANTSADSSSWLSVLNWALRNSVLHNSVCYEPKLIPPSGRLYHGVISPFCWRSESFQYTIWLGFYVSLHTNLQLWNYFSSSSEVRSAPSTAEMLPFCGSHTSPQIGWVKSKLLFIMQLYLFWMYNISTYSDYGCSIWWTKKFKDFLGPNIIFSLVLLQKHSWGPQ